MIIQQLLVLLVLLLVVVFVFWVMYGLFSPLFRKNTTAMYVASFDRHIKLMQNYLQLVRGKRLVDLGCGDGKAMRFFARTFGVQCDGYELLLFPFWYAKFLNRLWGYTNIALYKKDFFQANLHDYDYIYVYLLPQQMADIESRIFTQMKSDAIIISNTFQFAVHKPYEVIKNKQGKPSIFLYKKV